MTPINDDTSDAIEASERRTENRRTSDRHWLLTLVGVLGLVTTGSVAYGISSAQTQSALAGKVDRIEYVRDRASEESEISANRNALDGSQQQYKRLQAGIDSANVRLREIVCRGRDASCR